MGSLISVLTWTHYLFCVPRKSSFNTWVSFAEVASVQMEFTTLSRHSGNPIYAEKVMLAE